MSVIALHKKVFLAIVAAAYAGISLIGAYTAPGSNAGKVGWSDGGELVGANGRMGSFLLRQSNYSLACITREHNLDQIGMMSEPNEPIYVCTPGDAVLDVLRRIPPGRIEDACLVCNGFFPVSDNELFQHVTICVPHFGVLAVGSEPVCGTGSPPTIIHGKHAHKLKSLLLKNKTAGNGANILVEIEESRQGADEQAIKKLLWASILWLFTSDPSGDPTKCITVKEAHHLYSKEIRDLVVELLPAARRLMNEGSEQNENHDYDLMHGHLGSVSNIIAYLEAYSYSMPNATPSLELALKEVSNRNARFLRMIEETNMNPDDNQALHQKLLQRLGVDVSLHTSKIVMKH